MNKTIFSIVLVNWNGRKWLKKLLDSFGNQTYKNFELIMVDNSSTDDSVDFVSANYPWVKILHSHNLGFGHSCNVGAAAAIGKYLMFFNEDMFVDGNFLELFLAKYNLLKNKKHIGTIGCVINDYDRSKIEGDKSYGFGIDFMAAPHPNYKKNLIFHNTGCPLFIVRKLFLKIGGFCDNIFLYGEDVDICWRLNVYGYQHHFFDDITVFHNCGIGTFSEKKLSLYIKGEINGILNNFSIIFVIFSLFYLFIFYFLLSLIYLVIGKFSFIKIIYQTIWTEFRSNLNRILKFRKIVQSNRIISDLLILKKITIIPSRLRNLTFMHHYKHNSNISYLIKHLLKFK